jgi:hypothetical protein
MVLQQPIEGFGFLDHHAPLSIDPKASNPGLPIAEKAKQLSAQWETAHSSPRWITWLAFLLGGYCALARLWESLATVMGATLSDRYFGFRALHEAPFPSGVSGVLVALPDAAIAEPAPIQMASARGA